MRKLILLILFTLLLAGSESAQAATYGVPTFETAAWLTGWGLICLLAVAVFMFRSRLIAVRQEGECYRKMVENAKSIIMRFSEDGTIRYMNPFALEFFGWLPEEILGKNVYGTILPETSSDGHDMRSIWDRVLRPELQHETNENENQRKDGSRVWVAWTNTITTNAVGELEVLSVGTDRTVLREGRKLLEQIMLAAENVTYGVVVTDMESRVQFANSSWLAVYQLDDLEQVLGHRINLLKSPCELDDSKMSQLSEQLRLKGRACAEVDCGDIQWRFDTILMHSSTGTPAGYLGVIRDVTKEYKNAALLRKAKEEAEAAARTKSLILTNITHEIRTPLNGVQGMLQILLMGRLDKTQQDYVKTAMDSAKDLGAIIDSILMYSEVDSADLHPELQAFSLVNTALGLLEGYRGRAQEQGLTLSLETETGTRDGLYGDGRRIQQIVDILLGNAVKFTPKGGIILHLATKEKDSAKGAKLILSVEDTGVGISEERLPDILKGFVQGDQTYSRRFGGLGLGLGMAQKLAEMLGGELTVQSREGEGTTVTLSVGLELLDEGQGGQPLVLAPMLMRGERPRVLLTLGNGLDGCALKYYLQCRGVSVVNVEGPEQGVAFLNDESRPQLDMAVFHLGKMEQQSVLDALNESHSVPVVLLGENPKSICECEHVLLCAAYPIQHQELWRLLLELVAEK